MLEGKSHQIHELSVLHLSVNREQKNHISEPKKFLSNSLID